MSHEAAIRRRFPPTIISTIFCKKGGKYGLHGYDRKQPATHQKRKKLSIFTVSLELQMSHHHLGDIERGQTNPQIKTLARLTDYYGIHMKELFE